MGDEIGDEAGKNNVSASDTRTVPGKVPAWTNVDALGSTKTLKADEVMSDPLLGAQIGNFHVKSLLGRGGFGRVYRAEDVKLGRPLALKLLHDQVDPKHLRAFEREAQALAALGKHPNILQIHAWGEVNGQCYLALEYVESNAAQLLDASPGGIEIEKALKIIMQAAEALAYSHKAGVLHRDIKPANILIEKDGCVKIADFGLARFHKADASTLFNGISGSPPYMSPEQVRGGEMDERTDIYSLGVTLYELLSGRRPFVGSNASEVMENVRRNRRIPLSRYRKDLPKPLLALVERATAHNPDDRIQTALEFASLVRTQLQEWMEQGDISTMAPRSVRQRRRLSRIAAIVVLIAAVAGGLAYMSGAASGVAEAENFIDQRKLLEAERILVAIVERDAGDERAIFDLGYVYLLRGRLDDAERQFERLSDSEKRAEGLASVAHARDGARARAQLEQTAGATSSAYLRLLLAGLDLAEGKAEAVVQSLRGMKKSDFVFDWQWVEHQVLLGRALYDLGEFDLSAKLLATVSKSSDAMTLSVAEAVKDLARQRADTARQERVDQQISDLAKLLRNRKEGPAGDKDSWTSRPVTLCVLAADGVNSLLAREVGLTESLPWMLERSLREKGGHTMVDREVLDKALTEQSISELLSGDDPRVQLGRVLGARCLVQTQFFSVLGEDLLSVELIDTETTEQFPGPEVPIRRNMTRHELLDGLVDGTLERIRRAFPLRGRLSRRADGAVLNIGRNVGVDSGMRFGLMIAPHEGEPDTGRYAVVTEEVGPDHASVRLEGLSFGDIPPEGLFARLMQ